MFGYPELEVGGSIHAVTIPFRACLLGKGKSGKELVTQNKTHANKISQTVGKKGDLTMMNASPSTMGGTPSHHDTPIALQHYDEQ